MLKCGYLKQHVFLAGCQIHLVLVIVYTDVDNVCQKFLVARNHLQLLVQALHRDRDGATGHLQINSLRDSTGSFYTFSTCTVPGLSDAQLPWASKMPCWASKSGKKSMMDDEGS